MGIDLGKYVKFKRVLRKIHTTTVLTIPPEVLKFLNVDVDDEMVIIPVTPDTNDDEEKFVLLYVNYNAKRKQLY